MAAVEGDEVSLTMKTGIEPLLNSLGIGAPRTLAPEDSAVQYSLQGRAERLIALGRIILAVFSFLAIWLDPSEPAGYARTTFIILTGYLSYSCVLALAAWNWDFPTGRWRVISHAIDLTVFVCVNFFTRGPSSPFFVYFVFSLVCATVRWQMRGTLWTALAAFSALFAMAFYPKVLLPAPDFELNRFIIRIVYLSVVAVLLGYMGAYENKLRNNLSMLAAWPRPVSEGISSLTQGVLQQAAAIIGAPVMLLAWEEREEPWLHMALWDRGGFRYWREPPSEEGIVTAPPLRDVSFFCPDLRAPLCTAVYTSPAGLLRFQDGAPLSPALLELLRGKALLSLRVRGQNAEGYLFALDKPRMSSDDLVVGDIIAGEISARMEHFYLQKELQESAARTERIRLARDLHDGLLQSLAVAALQIEAVQRLLETDTRAARRQLSDIQRLIASEQKDLRSQINELKPARGGLPKERDLAARLEDLAERMERHWGLRAEVELKRTPLISGALAQDIYFIVHEAMINAARHAGASIVRAQVSADETGAHLTVTDNGRGFPFRGRYDLQALKKMNIGPVTLKDRIALLQGGMVIESGDAGARLEISLPLTGSGG